MIRNFEMFQSPKLGANRLQRAPVVVGHTEKDLHNSAVAKRGDHGRLYREGEVLKADIDGVDEDLANAIKAGNFEDVSAEIYHDPPDEFRRRGAKGKMFRRLAILGGDIPFVKGLNAGTGLKDKLVTCSESWPKVAVTRARRTRESGYTTFSEDVPMTRDEMVSKLTSAGGNAELLATYSEEQLAECVRLFDAAGQKVEQIATFSEGQLEVITDRLAEKLTPALNQRITDKLSANESALKRQRIDIFCETHLRSGRIDPADMDAGAGPTLADRLFALDDTAKVHTFSENGNKIEMTQLDAEMRAISKRAPRLNRERIPTGTGGVATFSEDANKGRRERLAAHIETYSEFPLIGMEPAEFLSAWDKANADNRRELELGVKFAG